MLGRETFVSAIASLNRAHVQRFQGQYYLTPNQCRRCAVKLNRPLPPNCMRHVFNHNIHERRVRCASIVDIIQGHRRGAPDMLVIDAEGAESTVLQQYFQSSLRLPSRIRYEKTYMAIETQHNITAHLEANGMAISFRGRMDVEWSSTTAIAISAPDMPASAKAAKASGKRRAMPSSVKATEASARATKVSAKRRAKRGGARSGALT